MSKVATTNVCFYGSLEALTKWKELVSSITGKKCEDIVPGDKIGSYQRYRFLAHMNEEDCKQMMTIWYDVEEGYDLAWNHRISFLKDVVVI